METLILTVHIILSVVIIGLILIQHGKGADAGAFGASNAGTIFGASGSSTFLSRTTAILTTLFFITSMGLAIIANKKSNSLYELDTVTEPAGKSADDKLAMSPTTPEQPVPKVETPRPVTETPVEVPATKTE